MQMSEMVDMEGFFSSSKLFPLCELETKDADCLTMLNKLDPACLISLTNFEVFSNMQRRYALPAFSI